MENTLFLNKDLTVDQLTFNSKMQLHVQCI
jgi:hypothetical protein